MFVISTVNTMKDERTYGTYSEYILIRSTDLW